jgi:hypothetical protein
MDPAPHRAGEGIDHSGGWINPHDIEQDGRVYTTQEFAKGWTFVQERLKP